MFSKRSLEGEILIDHTASPGVTPEETAGFSDLTVAKGEKYEGAIYTCGHCSCVIVKNPHRTRERGWCSHCDRYICDGCTYLLNQTLTCTNVKKTFEQVFEDLERYGPSPLLRPKDV